MKKNIGAILFVLSLFWVGAVIYKAIEFKINCGDRMMRAANASSISIARDEMEAVVNYLIGDSVVKFGYSTSILYKTPDEDLVFFYRNILDAREELFKLDEDEMTPQEKSQILIKLRGILTHKNLFGTTITVPAGISKAPHNLFYAIWGFISLIMGISGIWIVLYVLDDEYIASIQKS